MYRPTNNGEHVPFPQPFNTAGDSNPNLNQQRLASTSSLVQPGMIDRPSSPMLSQVSSSLPSHVSMPFPLASNTTPYMFTPYAPPESTHLFSKVFIQKQNVTLQNDKFIFDYPLSDDLMNQNKYRDADEFTKLRYTATTCDPDQFAKNYSLRQKELKRDIKISLVVTMYNEDDKLFCKSMMAVYKNLQFLCKTYGPDFWKHFVCVIVSDGRTKINPRTLTVLGVMGCYADGLIQTKIGDKPVTGHVFEYTSQIGVDKDGQIHTHKDGIPPLQTIFILKEKNAKKINSHRWFFNGICKVLNPEVCMLLDVGTKPTAPSFTRLYRTFDIHPNVGGACGEIAAELGPCGKNLLNPLVAAQNFEYKMSNILDKPLESVFGFISVLPGAFSAYRYKAIQGAPLDAYFVGETMHGGADVYKANMYLAEDRILCFEIVAKRNENWVLKYVKDAKAETDVPDALPELISQRRRWLNGSFFAAVHALLNWTKIYSSGHSFLRKVMLSFEFLYNLINLIFSWFSVGNFYLAFYFLFDVSSGSFSDSGVFGKAASPVFETTRALYAFLMVATLVTSLGNRPQGTKVIYHLTVIFFSLIMTLMLFLGTWAIIQSTKAYTDAVSKNPSLSFAMYLLSTGTFRDIVISVLSTYGLYLVSSVMAFDPWHVFTSMIQYLLLLPSYVNILMVYAFCNIHDISWGTKGDNVVVAQEGPKITTDASGQKIMETQVPSTNVADIDMAYQNMLTHLKRNMIDKPDGKQTVDQKTKQDDYFKEFRTRVVILWVTSNAILVYIFSATDVNKAIFPNRGSNSVNPYLTFLFWSVAGLSLIRFLFSTIFLIQFTRDKLTPDRSKYQRVANRV